ncbi:MAG: hypothetical protein ACTHL8_25560 [Burkholderiaceae bacterium]
MPAAALRLAPHACRLALAAIAFASAALAGCATPGSHAPDFVEPAASAPTARLRVVNLRPQAYYAAIAVFDSAACLDRANLGMTGGTSKDTERVGMLDAKPVQAGILERRVPAGELLVVGPRAVFPTVTAGELMHAFEPQAQDATRARQAGVCRVPSFTPKAGEQYEIVVDLTPAHCSVTPYRLSQGEGGEVKREEVVAQASRISTYEFDMKCFK